MGIGGGDKNNTAEKKKRDKKSINTSVKINSENSRVLSSPTSKNTSVRSQTRRKSVDY